MNPAVPGQIRPATARPSMMGRVRRRIAASATLLGALSLLCACPNDAPPRPVDTVLVDLSLSAVEPGVLLPNTTLVITGDAFVDDPWGQSKLVLEGQVERGGAIEDVELALPARFVDFTRLEVTIDTSAFEALGGGAGTLTGTAAVEVQSVVDDRTYRSLPINIDLELATALVPELQLLTPSAVIYPNEPLELVGAGLLLAGEGESVARLEGCFAVGSDRVCDPIEAREVLVTPSSEFARDRGVFEFVPDIAGIEPGRFEGTVTVLNRHTSGAVEQAPAMSATWDLVEPTLFGIDTTVASLGRYVTIDGAGFIGGEAGGSTVLRYDGIFTPDATGIPIELDELLFPEFVGGRAVRYVVNEEDGLSTEIKIRRDAGTFEGLVTPIIAFDGVEVQGTARPLGFRLETVRQIVWVNFTPAYKESLRLFGLRAVDQAIRDRVLEVLARDFASVGVEVRAEQPQDYALYTQVDIGGRDPNGLGLLGYDNTPGKDTENQRLYDRIGGANARTQDDGFPGFGGVFMESLFGYSAHPGDLAEPTRVSEEFDRLFDPFRPDLNGRPVLAADLTGSLTEVTGEDCPSSGDRSMQIACAVHALGTLVGSTVSHEVGHSLGLADPYGPAFHNTGDQDDRLMDADRPFVERAELGGAGPSRFCVDEYEYLRLILPSAEPYDVNDRPPCF